MGLVYAADVEVPWRLRETFVKQRSGRANAHPLQAATIPSKHRLWPPGE